MRPLAAVAACGAACLFNTAPEASASTLLFAWIIYDTFIEAAAHSTFLSTHTALGP